MKPTNVVNGVKTEKNRLDIKNFTLTPPELSEKLCENLIAAASTSDAVIALDHFTERNCGVITDGVRDLLASLNKKNPGLIVFGDSRKHIADFKNMVIKCNDREIVRVAEPEHGTDAPALSLVKECGARVFEKTGLPVFVTIGENGILVFDGSCRHVPGIKIDGLIDVCGAGDAATTGIASALTAGASAYDAAVIGNIAASITIRQLGTTGTASPMQIIEAFNDMSE